MAIAGVMYEFQAAHVPAVVATKKTQTIAAAIFPSDKVQLP